MSTEQKKNVIEIKRYTLGQLCKLYEVDRQTLRRWIKPFEAEIGPRCGYYYTIAQVKIIFSKLDYPETIIQE